MARTRNDTYWVLDPEQIQALASPRRMELIDRLAADGPLSAAELAARCRTKTTAIYHHLKRLLAVGLIDERTDADTRGAVYATKAPRMRLRKALEDPANAEVLRDVVAATLRQAERDFARGYDHPASSPDGPARTLGFFRLVSAPNEADLARLNAMIEEIAELMWSARDGGGPPIALSWVIAPLPDANDTESE
jgi:DNA-binding transcriptional ArsR family regulator